MEILIPKKQSGGGAFCKFCGRCSIAPPVGHAAALRKIPIPGSKGLDLLCKGGGRGGRRLFKKLGEFRNGDSVNPLPVSFFLFLCVGCFLYCQGEEKYGGILTCCTPYL
jgi:hypothetical protein